MPFRRKCKVCSEFITDEKDAVEYKDGFVHRKCFAISLKIAQDKRIEKVNNAKGKKESAKKITKVPKEGLSEEQYQEKVKYYEFIKTALNTDKIPAKIYATTEKYLKTYEDFTFKGMLDALRYCHEIRGLSLGEDCVGLTKYFYEEAERFYKECSEYQKNLSETFNGFDFETRTVKVRPHKARNQLINIEDIGD